MSPADQRRATWQRVLAEQQASGQSIIGWCFQHSIPLGTFYYWKKRVAAPVPTPKTPQWVALTAPTAHAPLMLRVGHVAIEVAAGFDPGLLQDVLACLEAR